jgi:hypothetical protein
MKYYRGIGQVVAEKIPRSEFDEIVYKKVKEQSEWQKIYNIREDIVGQRNSIVKNIIPNVTNREPFERMIETLNARILTLNEILAEYLSKIRERTIVELKERGYEIGVIGEIIFACIVAAYAFYKLFIAGKVAESEKIKAEADIISNQTTLELDKQGWTPEQIERAKKKSEETPWYKYVVWGALGVAGIYAAVKLLPVFLKKKELKE